MLTGVPKTAVGVARIRAAESRRPDRLFEDRYAAAFVAAMPDAYAEDMSRSDAPRAIGARIAFQVVIRTRFYDDYLLAAMGSGIRQVVLLAAGLDCRAFRLPWPAGTRVYELDLPEVLALKESVLAGEGAVPRCERTLVTADLTADWPAALLDAGFESGRSTAWLVEGLLVYLTADDAAGLLDTVGRLSATGSRLSCEQGRSAARLAAAAAEAGAAEATALWQGGLEDNVAGWLEAHGWSVEQHDIGALAADYGRPVATTTHSGFLVAVRT